LEASEAAGSDVLLVTTEAESDQEAEHILAFPANSAKGYNIILTSTQNTEQLKNTEIYKILQNNKKS
jgi:hypothetical protein